MDVPSLAASDTIRPSGPLTVRVLADGRRARPRRWAPIAIAGRRSRRVDRTRPDTKDGLSGALHGQMRGRLNGVI